MHTFSEYNGDEAKNSNNVIQKEIFLLLKEEPIIIMIPYNFIFLKSQVQFQIKILFALF